MLEVPVRGSTRWITAQRPARNALDPWKPHGFFLEEEADSARRVVSSGVVLLTNRECPWRCLMCDLWKNTLTQKVSRGAIPAQIEHALARFGSRPEQVKLYNSGSFFDAAAIPPDDYRAIARKVDFANCVIVESHPRLVGQRTLEFCDLLAAKLEVAMGLETAHPEVLHSLNKKFDLDDFRRAADFLRNSGVDLRVFILVNPPFLDREEALDWTIKSSAFAFSCGASVVSIIPTRAGNGAMDRLAEEGGFQAPRLSDLERAFEGCLPKSNDPEHAIAVGLRVFADTWDLERFSDCPHCFDARAARLKKMNLTQTIQPAVRCPACGDR